MAACLIIDLVGSWLAVTLNLVHQLCGSDCQRNRFLPFVAMGFALIGLISGIATLLAPAGAQPRRVRGFQLGCYAGTAVMVVVVFIAAALA